MHRSTAYKILSCEGDWMQRRAHGRQVLSSLNEFPTFRRSPLALPRQTITNIQTAYNRLKIHSTMIWLVDRKGFAISLLSLFTGGRASNGIVNLIKQKCFSDVRYEYLVKQIPLNYQMFYLPPPSPCICPYIHCACELTRSVRHVKQTSGSVNIAFKMAGT
jgi:hypothetical protein